MLANNAGAIVLQPITTVDGFELSIQANHLAPFLLTNLLRDRIGRMVVTASGAHRSGALDPDDLNAPLRRYRPMGAYGTSKQANILFTAEAARRWPDIPAYCFHPGVVRTRFGNDSRLVALGMRFLPFRSPEKGAETLVWLANQDPARLINGGYYADRRPRRPLRKAATRSSPPGSGRPAPRPSASTGRQGRHGPAAGAAIRGRAPGAACRGVVGVVRVVSMLR